MFTFASATTYVECLPWKYELFKTLSLDVISTDLQLRLVGTIDVDLELKLDKMMVSTGLNIFWLRATTYGGLIQADKEIHVVVCPTTGGFTLGGG